MKFIRFKNMYTVNLETGYITEEIFVDKGLIYKASRVGDLTHIFLKLLQNKRGIVITECEVTVKANYKGGYLLEWNTDGMNTHTVEAEILEEGILEGEAICAMNYSL